MENDLSPRVIVEKFHKYPESNGCKLSYPHTHSQIRCVCQSALKINRAHILDPDPERGSRTTRLGDNILCNHASGPEDYERKLTLIAKYMRQLIDRQMTGRIK